MKHRLPEKLAAAFESRKKFALVTIVDTRGSAPQEPGAKMLIFEDGSIDGTVGGGALEHRLIQEAEAATKSGKTALLHIDLKKDVGMICGGGMTAFIEPMVTRQPVVIMGCGHVSRALAPLLTNLEFSVTVVDERPEWADRGAFPGEVEVVCLDLEAYCETLGDLSDMAIVVMTRSHAFDYELLRFFVNRNPAYLGIMASRSKAGRMFDRLLEEGVDEELAKRVQMPMGIPIGSSSPAEIAVSIAAQLIKTRKESG